MKFLKSVSILIVLIISIFNLQICKPDDDIGKTYGPYTLGEARNYIDFKPGSWWVYQNNKSGLYDTLVLKSISIKTQTFTGKNTVIKDVINFIIYSETFEDEYKFYNLFTPNPDLPPKNLDFPFIDIASGKSNKTGYFGEAVTMFYPFDSVYIGGTGSHDAYYKKSDSIYVLKGKTYYSIRKFYLDHDNTWDRESVNYYWAKNVGLIKKEKIKTGESWDLINCNIVKP